MFSFIKKIFGFPTEAEKAMAQRPVVNSKSGEVVEVVDAPKVDPVAVALDLEGVTLSATPAVNDQITDAVTQAAPAKKTRKPRAPKVAVKEKAAKAKKPAAERAPRKSKKA